MKKTIPTTFIFGLLYTFLYTILNSNLAAAQTNNSKIIPQLKIELKLHLPNKLEYTLQISKLTIGKKYKFYLNKGLKIENLASEDLLTQSTENLEQYDFINQTDEVALFKVSGELLNEESIGPEVIVLNSASRWLPNLEDLLSYELIVKTEKDLVVFNPSISSEDCGKTCYHFTETRPQEDVHLIAGKYTEYQKTLANNKKIGVLLLSKDDLLAQQYMDLLPEFLDRYEKNFGEYPYNSFYVVENFNETGFGMPGFTLLGASVMRLPFILRSSLPHEVLHNWWGNSVYVDNNRGNWCEGLTTYGADHFEQQRLGLDANYRRDVLVSYEDFAKTEKEFSLNEFKGRHNEASQAIGYGKGMMLFHMLNKWMGNENFTEGLKNLNSTYKFQQIGFEEIQDNFANIGGADINTLMPPWVNKLGSVDIKVHSSCNHNGQAELQINSAPTEFQYALPYELYDHKDGKIKTSHLTKVYNGQQKIELPKKFNGYVRLDPNFDVFRKLSKGEKPLTLSRFLANDKIYILAEDTLLTEAQAWIQGLKQIFAGQVEWLKNLEDAPAEAQVIIYGFKDLSKADLVLKYLPSNKIAIKNNAFVVEGQVLPMADRGWLLMSYDKNKNQTLTWAVRPEAVMADAWGKQLSHYSKFGILFFNGKRNEVKTAWAEGESHLNLKIEPCL